MKQPNVELWSGCAVWEPDAFTLLQSVSRTRCQQMGTVQGRLHTQLLDALPWKHEHSPESVVIHSLTPNIKILRVVLVIIIIIMPVTFGDTRSFSSINILTLQYKFWLGLRVIADIYVSITSTTVVCAARRQNSHLLCSLQKCQWITSLLQKQNMGLASLRLPWVVVDFSVMTTKMMIPDVLQLCGSLLKRIKWT